MAGIVHGLMLYGTTDCGTRAFGVATVNLSTVFRILTVNRMTFGSMQLANRFTSSSPTFRLFRIFRMSLANLFTVTLISADGVQLHCTYSG